MIVLVGGTASGKTTLAKYLRASKQYVHVLEQTTRTMRDGEQNGKDYWFVDNTSYLHQVVNNELIGNLEFYRVQNGTATAVYYGTRKKDIEDAGLQSVLVTNADAAKQIKLYDKENGHKYKVFVVHVKIDELEQRRRLAARGDEPAEIEKRIKSDAKALVDINTYADYAVNNISSVGCIAEEILQAYKLYLSSFSYNQLGTADNTIHVQSVKYAITAVGKFDAQRTRRTKNNNTDSTLYVGWRAPIENIVIEKAPTQRTVFFDNAVDANCWLGWAMKYLPNLRYVITTVSVPAIKQIMKGWTHEAYTRHIPDAPEHILSLAQYLKKEK